jgi:hypothetical protein
MTASSDTTRRIGSLYRTIQQVADADRRYPGEGYAWEDQPWPAQQTSAETLWLLLSEADRAIRAARQVKARLEALMLADVQQHGAVRFGADVYYQGRDAAWRWADKDTSPLSLLGWLASGAYDRAEVLTRIHQTIRLDPAAVRITALRGEAHRRASRDGDPHPDLAADAAVDTFLVREGEDTPILAHHLATLDKCPAWARSLGHGQRRAPRKAPD